VHVYGPGPWMPPHLEFIVVGAVGATKICRFIWFGAVDATKPFYQFIKLGAVEATNTCRFVWFVAMEVTKPLIYSVWAVEATSICGFVGSGAMDSTTLLIYSVWGLNATETCRFMWFGAVDATKPLSIYKLGDGCHQHWYICMVRGHGGHQTRLVYRVWGRGVLWLLAGPSERTQNLRTKPGPKGPKTYFRNFQTWPCPLVLGLSAGPARGQLRTVRNINFSGLPDMACCRPRDGAQNQRTRPGPKGPTS
jgi:hypothetical protein